MNEEIKATPNTFVTSTLTPIHIQDSTNIKICFNGIQVDNNADLKKNIKGSLIFQKKTKSQTFEKSKFTRKDLSPYEMIELSFDTDATYALYTGLNAYFQTFGGKQTTPNEEVSYIRVDDDIKLLKQILEKKNLLKLLEQVDTNTLNQVLNVKNLQLVKTEIESNLNNSDEGYWQNFFSMNAWTLSQLFNAPVMIYNGARYVGGKTIDNKNSKITDFIYKNNLTKNISLVEIKTPTEKFFTTTEYRQGVPNMSENIIGGVNQLLAQRQNLYEDYALIRSHNLDNNIDDFKVVNIQSILLVGKIDSLTQVEIKTLEAYRNELKNICIVTFDELLHKVDYLINVLND